MKTKLSLFLLAFLLIGGSVFAQRIRVPDMNAYKKLMPIDSLLFTVQYEITMREWVDHPEKLTNETMMLRVGQNCSEYYSYASFVADSILRVDIESGASQQTIREHLQQYGSGTISHRIYKNYPKGKLTLTERIMSDNYLVEEPLPKIDWEIHADTATVCGYVCQKATARFRGRDYEAWYTPEIPRSDGPWKLQGLPGLILKASDSQQHFQFLCTGIEQSKSGKLIEFSENSRRKVSRKELNKLLERFNADPLGYVAANSPNINLKIIDKMGNEMKKVSNPYNPIELE